MVTACWVILLFFLLLLLRVASDRARMCGSQFSSIFFDGTRSGAMAMLDSVVLTSTWTVSAWVKPVPGAGKNQGNGCEFVHVAVCVRVYLCVCVFVKNLFISWSRPLFAYGP